MLNARVAAGAAQLLQMFHPAAMTWNKLIVIGSFSWLPSVEDAMMPVVSSDSLAQGTDQSKNLSKRDLYRAEHCDGLILDCVPSFPFSTLSNGN